MKYENEHLSRQLDLIPINVLGERITIIGSGAIGGWTALGLAKMGFLNIGIIDFDKVEIENMNSQLFRLKDIGRNKVDAIDDLISEFTGHHIDKMIGTYVKETFPGIVISAVDSMEVRKNIWQAHVKSPNTKAIIDPRMGAETALLYVMNPMNENDRLDYPKTLYTDADAVQEPCTAKSTAYCAMALAGLVCAQVKSLATGNKFSRTTQWAITQGAFHSWKSE